MHIWIKFRKVERDGSHNEIWIMAERIVAFEEYDYGADELYKCEGKGSLLWLDGSYPVFVLDGVEQILEALEDSE
jgi:hypothetical protein